MNKTDDSNSKLATAIWYYVQVIISRCGSFWLWCLSYILPNNFSSSAYSESITTTIIIKKSTKCWTKAARNASKLGVTRPRPGQPPAASSRPWPRQTSCSSASFWWRPGSCPRCCLPHSLWWNTCHKSSKHKCQHWNAKNSLGIPDLCYMSKIFFVSPARPLSFTTCFKHFHIWTLRQAVLVSFNKNFCLKVILFQY